jgi:uncharacterized protein (TIGR03067 family)
MRTVSDLAALQGVWEQVGLEVDGVINPPDELSPPGALTNFHGNRFAVHAGDGALLLEGNFTLDASVTPKRVDWMDAIGPDRGRILPAIYELDGDHFRFIAGDPDAPRPTAFHTASGQTMRTFRRR